MRRMDHDKSAYDEEQIDTTIAKSADLYGYQASREQNAGVDPNHRNRSDPAQHLNIEQHIKRPVAQAQSDNDSSARHTRVTPTFG